MKKKKAPSYYDLAIQMIAEKRAERDRRIGTIMLLAHDECISHGRAAELCDMTTLQWRREWIRMVKEYKP